jgi:predicted nuclease of restriction endonuclease-like (RecB) superfamily
LSETLQPHFGSGFTVCQLFERLIMSNDVKEVLALAREEKLPSNAKEIIKDPMVLEFLGLKR